MLFFFIGAWLFYNVVLVSTVQQSEVEFPGKVYAFILIVRTALEPEGTCTMFIKIISSHVVCCMLFTVNKWLRP